MLARIVQTLCLGSLALIAMPGFAGEDAPPDREQIREQFRQAREQFLQNMQDKGIDPQEFFRNVGEEMRDGKLDLEGLQKRLVDKGIVDEKQLSQFQTRAQEGMLSNIRRQLNVNDEEWAALLPKIQRVVTASAEVNSGNQFGGAMGGFMRPQTPTASTGAVAKSARELQTTIKNPDAAPAEYQQKLAALREAKQKAQTELEAAQKDLTEVLTARQEAALVLLGLL